ncbi:MAG: diadenylate cyclase CdaA [Bacteroidales bacterium]|nr:diadenylate cyclase CdaA [Bacteroidales bacterium]
MIPAFITIRLLDIIDIFVVALLMFQLYKLIKGTVAMNIFIVVIAVYFLWRIAESLNMLLLGNILGSIIGVGVIALLIVFQNEVRRFLLLIGTKYFSRTKLPFFSLFTSNIKHDANFDIEQIVTACINLSRIEVGALIVIAKESPVTIFSESGEIIDAVISSELIETIFAKNTPLHDGAMIIVKGKIHAARCVLPVAESYDLPHHFGMRHRSALGMSEQTDAMIIVVSEETGNISIAKGGKMENNLSQQELSERLHREFV